MRGPAKNTPDGRDADELLRAAVGGMAHGLSVWGEDRRLALFNPQYLEMYRFPADRVRPGMAIIDICRLTIEIGNETEHAAEDLRDIYARRLDEADAPHHVMRAQQKVRDRIVKTSHIRAPGIGWIVTHEDITAEIEQRRRADENERSFATQSLRLEAAVHNMREGLCMFDRDERLVICNTAYAAIYNLPPGLVETGTPHAKIIEHRMAHGMKPVSGADSFMTQHWQLRHDEVSRIVDVELSDGRIISIHHQPMADGGWVATHLDVTEDRRREREMMLQGMRFEAAINNISQGLCMFDKDERLVVCNRQYINIYRLPEELGRPGTSFNDIIEHRFREGFVPELSREQYLKEKRSAIDAGVFCREVREMPDGRAIGICHHPMQDGGWVSTHEDVTEQRRQQARIQHLARHDALTDLPNRALLREEMDKLASRIERHEIVGVLCLDLDHFKAVNDTLGHGAGDQVLVTVANRLKTCSRDSDIVARLGGDEFAILVNGLDSPEDAATIAARIVKAMSEPMDIDGRSVSIGASVGIAVAPYDGTDAEMLLKNADLALYRAKADGRGTFHFFERGMDEALQHRRMLEQGLKAALARNEFRLMYQPLLDLRDNRVCCFEALLRWDHPERGVISPAEFIPVAEETGLISAIGEWVLREACRTAAAWPERVRIAVNLSAAQFKSHKLVDHVIDALSFAGISPERLELEVTESLLLADTEETLATLHRLRALGARISMDDFGTGYSSLSYLRSFPFDKIKIDRSFIDGLGPDDDSMAIIKAVIGLGQSLGMSTTAEGIETEEQLAAVREQGCDEAQGFLFSPPLPASAAAALVQAAPAAAIAGNLQRRKRG